MQESISSKHNTKEVSKTEDANDANYENSEIQKNIEIIAKIIKERPLSQIIIHAKENIEPRDKETGLTYKPDLDTRVALYLFNNFNKRKLEDIYEKEGASTSLIVKGGDRKNLQESQIKTGVNMLVDVGNDFIRVEEDSDKIYITLDHHWNGMMVNTSATEIMYKIMEKAEILSNTDTWLRRLVNSVTDADNMSFVEETDKNGKKILDKKYFLEKLPYRVSGILSSLPTEIIFDLFQRKLFKSKDQILEKSDLEGTIGKTEFINKTITIDYDKNTRKKIYIKKERPQTIKDVALTREYTANKILTQLKEIIKENRKNNIELDNTIIGKIILILNELNADKKEEINYAWFFMGAKALGYQGIASYDENNTPSKKKFFVSSMNPNMVLLNENLKEIFPKTKNPRGYFIFSPNTGDDLKLTKFSKENFISVLNNKKTEKPIKDLTESEIEIMRLEDHIKNIKKEIKEVMNLENNTEIIIDKEEELGANEETIKKIKELRENNLILRNLDKINHKKELIKKLQAKIDEAKKGIN